MTTPPWCKGESHGILLLLIHTNKILNLVGSILCMEKHYPEAISEIEEAIAIVQRYLKHEQEISTEETDDKIPKKVTTIPQKHSPDAWSNLATYHINLGRQAR